MVSVKEASYLIRMCRNFQRASRTICQNYAQVIYLAAHDNALEQYADPEKRRVRRIWKKLLTELPGQP
jgi:hypothetical protein